MLYINIVVVKMILCADATCCIDTMEGSAILGCNMNKGYYCGEFQKRIPAF